MNIVSVEEVTLYFQSYGLKCDEELVKTWLDEEKNKSNTTIFNEQINEDYLYTFNDWCRWKGTAYEDGIDDQTKMDRLFEEVIELKKEIEKLEKEKAALEESLGVLPF
ncbi:hypothetical protein [Mesobacillus maritimus]|uniref:hypothetical protein n=1 Tax=Mesobacillus maritimus TaxID=1643336 RepID=UPI00384DED22